MSYGWVAQWVEPVEDEGLRSVQRPVYQLVGLFSTPEIARAELRITAHGLYEAFINGAPVGDRLLTPGFTAYRKRLQVQTYDVTGLVSAGDNALGVQLSDGWWRGQNSIGRRTNAYGSSVGVLAELTLTTSTGAARTYVSDGSWLSRPSHILAADLVAGEVHDMRARDELWATTSADRQGWTPVRVADHGYEHLVETVGPAVRAMYELPAASVTRVSPQRHIVDFGQVSNGWVRLTDLGPAGTELTIIHGECLAPAGDAVQIEAHEVGVHQHEGDWRLRFQTDVVISAGDGATFEPRHSTKGFRYVSIDGHPGPLDPSSLASIVVHSDLAPIGAFECSDPDLNWLHLAADWSLRTNTCDIPTDCPTRERAGWTGDWQIYVDTAAYLYDVTDFSSKWLLDCVAEQLPSGAILHFVPDPADHSSESAAWWTALQGSAGWGDAIVHVPWELYLSTGRTDVLESCFTAAQRWVDFAAGRAASGRHPTRTASRPEPADHERFLWDSGFHFGEWNEPATGEADGASSSEGIAAMPSMQERLMAMDHGPTATAFLHRSASEVAAMAEVLGEAAVAESYRSLADSVREAWCVEFVVDGHVVPQTQPNLVRALAFDLLPEQLRAAAVSDLVGLIRAAGTHLGTGFLATPFLLPVLADHGQLELAGEVLTQRSQPSWLAMRDQGATTIWEGWEPFDSDGRVKESLNHFSMGACIGFLHRYVAGLQILEPGYRRFRVAPQPAAGVTWAKTEHESPYGRIEVSWRIEGREGSVDITVPDGTDAELALPGADSEMLTAGKHHRSWLVMPSHS